MNSSSSSLSSDWDVVSQNSADGNSYHRKPLNAWNGDPGRANNDENCPPMVSGVDDDKNDENCPPIVSGVDDINDAFISNQVQDHNSSSDIEVIEETLEDLIQMPFPTKTYSINSSIRSDSSDSTIPPPVPVKLGWIMLFRLFQKNLKNSFQGLQGNSQLKACLLLVSVSVFVFALIFYGPPNEMKDQIEILKKENDYLKGQAISAKTESEKLFLIFAEQIKALRSENQRLSEFMQSLKKQMEQQTSKVYKASPNCFVNFFHCFSQTFIPKWW